MELVPIPVRCESPKLDLQGLQGQFFFVHREHSSLGPLLTWKTRTGTTNPHGGWFQGAEALAPHTREDVTSRVILLSGGCANAGLVEPEAINVLALIVS
jgi:hypothetical protein